MAERIQVPPKTDESRRLRVNLPGDRYELEADRMAAAAGFGAGRGGWVQRSAVESVSPDLTPAQGRAVAGATIGGAALASTVRRAF